jgi:hypothetical protein
MSGSVQSYAVDRPRADMYETTNSLGKRGPADILSAGQR